MRIEGAAPIHTVFLLSPANLGGQRASMVLNPAATFLVARQLHSGEGATIRDVFSFVSGLYFRGKATYSRAFARPPEEDLGALVICPGEGLRPLNEKVDIQRLRGWATVAVDEDNRDFTAPLIEDASALERAYGATTRFVLLGSVASDKYVRPLTHVFGDHLWFPAAFVGRGDMSRGALMLNAARAADELEYVPVEQSARRSRRR